MNESILTLILLVPLRRDPGCASLPDRGKLPKWIALLTTLVSFGLTLHLPAHFLLGSRGFQFEINKPWIELRSPAHLLSRRRRRAQPVAGGAQGCLRPWAYWQAGTRSRNGSKIFYSLFLVQQTAMFGVFVSLDLMLYYGFWELSLVPMAILIAMYGRKDGPEARLKFFLFTFIPSAPLLVAILWLYAQTGTFDFVAATVLCAHPDSIPARRCSGARWRSCLPSP